MTWLGHFQGCWFRTEFCELPVQLYLTWCFPEIATFNCNWRSLCLCLARRAMKKNNSQPRCLRLLHVVICYSHFHKGSQFSCHYPPWNLSVATLVWRNFSLECDFDPIETGSCSCQEEVFHGMTSCRYSTLGCHRKYCKSFRLSWSLLNMELCRRSVVCH